MPVYDHLPYFIGKVKEFHNRGPPPVTGIVALPAPLCLIECKILIFLRVETGVFKEICINLDRGLAVLAQGPCQPLGQDAVKG